MFGFVTFGIAVPVCSLDEAARVPDIVPMPCHVAIGPHTVEVKTRIDVYIYIYYNLNKGYQNVRVLLHKPPWIVQSIYMYI